MGRRRRAERRAEGRGVDAAGVRAAGAGVGSRHARHRAADRRRAKQIEAGAAFAVKRVVVPTGFTAAKRIRAIALKQGDRRVVRHAAFYEDATGRWLGGWTAWQTAVTLPDGLAYRLPAGAKIVVELGYSGTDEAVTDRSELGLYFDTGTGAAVDGMTLSVAAGRARRECDLDARPQPRDADRDRARWSRCGRIRPTARNRSK